MSDDGLADVPTAQVVQHLHRSTVEVDAGLAGRRGIGRRGGGLHVGIRGPLTLPAATLPPVLAFLETPGWTLATADAKLQLTGALAKLRAAGVTILDRSSSGLIEAIETALLDARPLSITRLKAN